MTWARELCPNSGVVLGKKSALVSGSSDPCLSSGWEHCVVFLGSTLYTQSASVYPDVEMSTGEFNVEVTLRWTSIPFGGRVQILLVAACYRNRDTLRQGQYADFPNLFHLTVA